jgi:methionine-S-sulfoxide reductase
MHTITLGGGCFWCLEAVYLEMNGVISVESGYMGGHIEHPTYEQVCHGSTGHAEVVRLQYDSEKVSLQDILAVFFKIHDPTSLNRQGADVGTQYRSVIFTYQEADFTACEKLINELNESDAFAKPIVTEVQRAGIFYPAEDYHQNYFANHPEQAYCRFVVQPKVEKFRKVFSKYQHS